MTQIVDGCHQPPALSEDDLSAVLTGVADETILGHLSACPYCARRLYDMRVFERVLATRMFRQSCPDVDVLSEFVLGRLEAGMHARMAKHLATCIRCGEEIDWLRAAQLDSPIQPQQRIVSDPTPGARPGGVQGDLPSLVERVRRIVGRLLPARPELALRGHTDERTWSATFEGGRVFVELRPEQGQVRMTGQLIMEAGLSTQAWVGALVQIQQVDTLVATAFLDDLGEFACDLANDAPISLTITSLGGMQLHLHSAATDD